MSQLTDLSRLPRILPCRCHRPCRRHTALRLPPGDKGPGVQKKLPTSSFARCSSATKRRRARAGLEGHLKRVFDLKIRPLLKWRYKGDSIEIPESPLCSCRSAWQSWLRSTIGSWRKPWRRASEEVFGGFRQISDGFFFFRSLWVWQRACFGASSAEESWRGPSDGV